MPWRKLTLAESSHDLQLGLRELAAQVQLPGPFSPGEQAEAVELTSRGPILAGHRDLTALDFVTIDPAGSRDLDQALLIEELPTGFRVWYAIVDLAAWLAPGGLIDQAARERGQTIYRPDGREPLHPLRLSEQAASLLADGVARPANVWRIDLDAEGEVRAVDLVAALVRSRAQLDYPGVQRALDAGRAPRSLELLRVVGRLRQQREIDRGGVSLDLPEQEIVHQHGRWSLRLRHTLPVEGWNAQISLLTGMCAAELMAGAGVGVLRTLPPAEPGDIARLRRIAASLQIDWPAELGYPAFIHALQTDQPTHQAMLTACTTLFRGAGYRLLSPGDPAAADPGELMHAALASRYAHATAPLRRLVDRYVGATCRALAAGQEVPGWVAEGLPGLPRRMGASEQRARSFERGSINRVEALVLSGREGEDFRGTIVELDSQGNRGVASIAREAVLAPVTGNGLRLGTEELLRLERAEVRHGEVAFTLAEQAMAQPR